MTNLDIQTLIDLRSIEQGKRLTAWSDTVTNFFPGMRIESCPDILPVGLLRHACIDGTHAWLVDSGQIKSSYSPQGHDHVMDRFVSLMLTVRGDIEVNQQEKTFNLNAGSLCLLENHKSFSLDVKAPWTTFLILQIPRAIALQYLSGLNTMTGNRFEAENVSTKLVRHQLLNVLRTSHDLSPDQQRIALHSFLQLLRTMEPSEKIQQNSELSSHRVYKAMELITEQLAEVTLSAESIASSIYISRRQLDRLFQAETGMSLVNYIWDRRLLASAEMLQDPKRNGYTVIDIALNSGFKDAAHFTRAFKQKYQMTPKQWRLSPRPTLLTKK